MKKVLSFGEIIWDVYKDNCVIGGAPLNFCGHCVKCGLDGYLVSSVGNDRLGKVAIEAIGKLGINCDFITVNQRPTGQCIVTLDKNSVPTYRVLENTAYDGNDVTDSAVEKIKLLGFDAFSFGTLAQRDAVSRKSLLKILAGCDFGEIFCDINLRKNCYNEESVLNCLKYATILKISNEEEPLLKEFGFWSGIRADNFGRTAENLFEAYRNIKYIIYTKGKNGASVYGRDKAVSVPSYGELVVSTVGAGDSFGAVWLAMYLNGFSPEAAADVASHISGYVVSVKEAIPEYSINDYIKIKR